MKTQSIEVDDATATALAESAAERGVSVPELVAELAVRDLKRARAAAGDIAELEGRWKAFQAQQTSVANGDVVRWLETWGTPAFRSWHKE